jgi:hypothetical protein
MLLRALVRRRRLEARLAEDDSEPTVAEQTATRRRRKKRKDYGEKPGFVDAWIGEGPLPTSLSTEALLEVIQVSYHGLPLNELLLFFPFM